MTQYTQTRPPISGRRMTLATDLDGTFLGGSKAERRVLYDWIEQNRDSIGLIFVTGRDPAFIIEMCRDNGLPWPEYVVGDVGTTIAKVRADGTIAPIPALEADIALRWNDAGPRVEAALDGHPGLTRQPIAFRHRISYDLNPAAYDPRAEAIVNELGLDWLISDNRYFDVLPRGVSKGPSITRLIAHLGIPPETVLCAGDTLNDLSMLVSGLPAVAVGNAEPPLLEQIDDHPRVYHARAHGAAGILEAIDAMNLHDIPKGV